MAENSKKKKNAASKVTLLVALLALLPLLLMRILQNSAKGVVYAYVAMTVVYVGLYLFGGGYASKNVKELWYLPVLPTIILMFFSWFTGGNPLANALYWGRGSLMGVLLMLLTAWLRRQYNK